MSGRRLRLARGEHDQPAQVDVTRAAPDQSLVVYTPEPDTETAERIALLASRAVAPAG